MFKEYLAKYLEELKASGVKVNLVEKNSLTMFALWLNKSAAQQMRAADGAGCVCPNELAWQYSGGICLICNKPRR